MSDFFSERRLIMILGCISISACVSAPTHPQAGALADQAPIANPFGDFASKPATAPASNITLRTKRGDESVEVELPESDSASELSVPMNPRVKRAPGSEAAIGEVSENGVDYQYLKNKASAGDREITSTFRQMNDAANDAKKQDIESSLGLQESDEPLNMDESYLAKVDIVKQLFRNGRFEAGLLEIDQLIKLYPTSAKLYEMRGTLLDRMGYSDLALTSWKQAYEFEPRELALKKMIDKRETQRSVASQARPAEPSAKAAEESQ